MDKTTRVLENLKDWQENNYENVETLNDIKVFNSVGALVTLLGSGLMSIVKTYDFITEVLNLETAEKEKVYQIFADAYNKKEEGKDEKEGN